ncbi:MAG TPA: hypothetical protein VG273_05815 [Bryobacteraceae bacterium]|jgi:hypothetical protein|nr:hypothetical protein [Bryobacteraceae bacterium]
MISLFAGMLLLIAAMVIAFQFFFKLRTLRAAEALPASKNVAGRYRPMLRLLSDEDIRFIAGDPIGFKALRAERRKLFRRYLSCLTKDYARLLAGIRMVMVQSGVDRPDLAKALAKNRALFALAICKVEFRLALHAAGIGAVDVSGLVGAFDTLHDQIARFSAVPNLA